MSRKSFWQLLYLESLGLNEVILPEGVKTKAQALEEVRRQVLRCTRCDLHKTKTHYVFGSGNPYADLMFVGEAPGAEEDKKGKPFVGRAGQLLDRLLQEVGLNRETDLYITNVLKCRPPRNRDPEPDEIQACFPYLKAQIQILRPRLLVALGRFAAWTLYGMQKKMSLLRMQVQQSKFGIPLVVTYHPAAALRREALTDEMRRDFQLMVQTLEQLRQSS